MEYLGEQVLEEYQKLGLTNTYMVFPMRSVTPIKMMKYVSKLIAHNLHIPRFSDHEPMTKEELLTYYLSPSHDPYKYVGIDLESGEVVCEIVVNNFIQNSGQLHFSLLAELGRSAKLQLGKIVPEIAVKYIKRIRPIESLVGLTPVLNKLACNYVLKTGFDKLGTVKGACKYKNQVCDAMLTTKNVRGL